MDYTGSQRCKVEYYQVANVPPFPTEEYTVDDSRFINIRVEVVEDRVVIRPSIGDPLIGRVTLKE